MPFIQFCYLLLQKVILAFELLDLHEVASVLVDLILGIREALRGVHTEGVEKGQLVGFGKGGGVC